MTTNSNPRAAALAAVEARKAELAGAPVRALVGMFRAYTTQRLESQREDSGSEQSEISAQLRERGLDLLADTLREEESARSNLVYFLTRAEAESFTSAQDSALVRQADVVATLGRRVQILILAAERH